MGVGLQELLLALVVSVLYILAGLVYFMVNLWIVKAGSSLLGYSNLSSDWAILSAVLLTFAGIVSTALESKRRK